MTLDFEGTSDQAVGPINFASSPKFLSKLLGATFKPFVPDLVLNEGVTRIFKMKEPRKGSIVNPTFPAPVAHRTVTMARVLDTFQGVMANALPGRVSGAMDTICLFTIHGKGFDGDPFFFREIVGAGSGGRNHSDGLDAVDMIPESKNIPTEFIEMVYPSHYDVG
ncbi:MAG: hydantoinase B/oxoprolinase family protein [Rhodobacteraceae bacterium]|nr:hydantoinase B/oxoprolinase family protein [Paracoccaceae bacterium]